MRHGWSARCGRFSTDVLEELCIERMAVWNHAVFLPGKGLTVLTGESGAGKSLVLEAIRLSLGERASGPVVRHGERRANLTSRWRGQVADAETGGEEDLVIRREIAADGRSVCRMGDAPVTLSRLRSFGRALVKGGRQGDAQRLNGEDAVDMLDRAVGVWPLRERIAGAYRAVREASERLTAIEGADPRERERRIDYLNHAVEEIERAEPRVGEEAELTKELGRLRQVERLRAAMAMAVSALAGEGDAPAARDLLRAALVSVKDAADVDADLVPVSERLLDMVEQVEDVSREAGHYLEQLEADPQRERELADRLALLADLRRKYGETLSDVWAFAEQAKAERDQIYAMAEDRDRLVAERLAAEQAWRSLALELSGLRVARATKLAEAVEKELRSLALERARLMVEVMPDLESAPAEHGLDRIALLFQANQGEPLRPLADIASGGETSRVFLAVESVMAEASPGCTWLFDEVEAGVGGEAAWAVARALLQLAQDHQVIAVTHLAPIAAVADDHWRAVKQDDPTGRVEADLCRLEGDARVAELARLLSGGGLAAFVHARAVLERAAKLRQTVQEARPA